jgi:hypothetical protein
MQNRGNVLLVEGTSDSSVISSLWRKRQRTDPPFDIDVRWGLNNLRDAFRASFFGSEVGRLGVVVDADANIAKRWPAFYQVLREHRYAPVPRTLGAEGLIIRDLHRNVPSVGVWVMPDNINAGRLEDFVARIVHANDSLWTHTGNIVATLPPELRRFKDQHVVKAHVYSWLALQEEPGIRLGPAVTRNLLDTNAEAAVRFVTWLSRLFLEDVGSGIGQSVG